MSDMARTAIISTDRKYRWVLSRRWNHHAALPKTVCWVMLNPSTADAGIDDPTIISCIKRSQNWGYDRLVVVNLYPFRSSSPRACIEWDAGQQHHNSDAHIKNRGYIYQQTQEASLVVAAWGAATWINPSCLTALPPELWCIGKTKNGAPKHPLARGKHRVPENTLPEIWRPT